MIRLRGLAAGAPLLLCCACNRSMIVSTAIDTVKLPVADPQGPQVKVLWFGEGDREPHVVAVRVQVGGRSYGVSFRDWPGKYHVTVSEKGTKGFDDDVTAEKSTIYSESEWDSDD
jgi:hypothetical protein